MNTKLKIFAAVALGLLTIGASWAQVGGGGMGGGGMGGAPGGMGGRRGHDANTPRDAKPKDAAALAETRIEQVNDRLAELKNRLSLTPEQVQPYTVLETKVMAYFLDASRPPAAVSGQQTAVQFVQQRLTVAQNRYTLMEEVADAVQVLYKGLTPAQQKIADQLLPAAIPQGGSARSQTVGSL